MRMNRFRRKSKMRSINRRNKVNHKTEKRTQKKTKKRNIKRTNKKKRKLRGGMDPVQGEGGAAAPGAAGPGVPSDPGEMGKKGPPVAAFLTPTQAGRLPSVLDEQGPRNLATEDEKKAFASLPLSAIIGEDGDKIIDDPLSYIDEMNKLKSDIARQAGIIKGLASEKKILESEVLVQTQLARGLMARFPELSSENQQLKTENQQLKTENQQLRSDCGREGG